MADDGTRRDATGQDGTPGTGAQPIARARAKPGAWLDVYLVQLAEHGDTMRAAAEAGVSAKTVRNKASRDPAFREARDRAAAIGSVQPPEVREEWVERFLVGLRFSGSIRFACRATSVSRDIVWALRFRDADFRQRMELAIDEANDALEAAARIRALGGSDPLMMFLLKAAMPEKYGDTLRIGRILEREEQNVYDDAISMGHAPEVAMAAVSRWRTMIGAPANG